MKSYHFYISRETVVYYKLDLIFIVLATVTAGYGNMALGNSEFNCEYNDIITDGNDCQS